MFNARDLGASEQAKDALAEAWVKQQYDKNDRLVDVRVPVVQGGFLGLE